MELTVWLGLLASALFISISPGPGAIFSISQGTQYGFKRAMFSVAGLQLGLISQILFLLLGLGVLINQFPSVFIFIKFLGMLYLIVLGVLQWRKKIEQIATNEDHNSQAFNPLKAVLQGFFVNLTNIKGTVFFLALIPLFIDLTALKLSTCIIFTSTLIVIDLIVMAGYVTLAQVSKALLADPKKILWQNRLTGSTLILVGLIMGTTKLSITMKIFHLAFTVKDLDSTRQFYGELLGCQEGRSSDTWVDFNFFGHQLSLHVGEVIQRSKTNSKVDDISVPMPHYGCVIEWGVFYDLAAKLQSKGMPFIVDPCVRYEGRPGEQATMFFEDYSGNALEFKAYRNPSEVFAS